MTIRTIFFIIALFSIALFYGCGGSSPAAVTPAPAAIYETATTANYKLTYLPVTSSTEGKTSYKIRLTKSTDGTALPGKTITIMPIMYMTGYNHSTPCTPLTDNGDGTYSGTIYYNMASVMADGSSMGKWELKYTVDGESAVFNPAVTMGMGTVVKLKGVTDKIGSMSGTPSSRSYLLYNDGISGSSVKLFLAAVDDAMMMKFPSLSTGTILHDSMGNAVPVTTMTVEVSADKITWTTLTDNGNGFWSKPAYSMLAAGSKLYVRLTVNGELKTTDGAALAADGSNGYQSLTIAGM